MSESFGKRIKHLREANKLKQADLGKILGVSASAIGMYEQDRREPSMEMLVLMSDIFDVEISYFYGQSEYNPDKPRVTKLSNENICMIPIYNNICDKLNPNITNDDIGYYPICALDCLEPKELFALAIKDDSMFPEIKKKDTLLIREQKNVANNSIAALTIDNGKGLIRSILYGEDWIELHAINPQYPIMRFEKEDIQRIAIIGRVEKLIREI